jgi:hypothetical protein
MYGGRAEEMKHSLDSLFRAGVAQQLRASAMMGEVTRPRVGEGSRSAF